MVINMFLGEVYSVFVDGMFVGVCENEDECLDVAQNHLNGIDILSDDNIDRVFWNSINVNRFYRKGQNICDYFSNISILCADYMIAKDGIRKLNKMNIERERAEAKIRALQL